MVPRKEENALIYRERRKTIDESRTKKKRNKNSLVAGAEIPLRLRALLMRVMPDRGKLGFLVT
jgi:hypothetical protein